MENKMMFMAKQDGTIERLPDLSNEDFFDWLACAVIDSDWEEANGFYREVICRKLVRLGVLKLEGDYYVLPEPEQR